MSNVRRHMKRRWLAFWSVIGLAWVVVSGLAIMHAGELTATPSGKAILTVLAMPLALLAYLLAHAIGEAVVHAALLVTFKLVTLNLIETEYTNANVKFPWYGLARNEHERLVASEDTMAIIAIVTYVTAGVVAYFVYWSK
jgi:hypothetical protein